MGNIKNKKLIGLSKLGISSSSEDHNYSRVPSQCNECHCRLPKQKSVLKGPLGGGHSLLINNTIRSGVWKISGKLWCRQGYQKLLSSLFHELDEDHLLQAMNRPEVV